MDFQGTPASGTAACGGAPAPTEIFLAPLEKRGDGIALGTPVNISNSPGYDNQPSFSPDGRSILFTSTRGSPSQAAATTDIYRYDLASRQTTRVTGTPECEYSPALTPDGKRISVVRVEADGTQRLWTFALDGAEPSLVLNGIKPVGYYAWIDASRLALYVLGQPATLQIADVRTGKAHVIAQNVGRSIQRVAGGEIAFVQRSQTAGGSPELTIVRARIPPASSETLPAVLPIVPPVPGSTEPYPVWLPDGTALMAHESALYRWRPGDAGWTPVADLAGAGLTGVTRLAVSPQGDRLALVASGR
jgi:dipeptidyl aminopeptidase/acylaminoacyl peptidase